MLGHKQVWNIFKTLAHLAEIDTNLELKISLSLPITI